MPKAEYKIPVKDYEFNKNMTVNELVTQMDAAWGFTAGKLATGINIMEDMLNSRGCIKFLSFPADICATGTRGVIKEMVKRKMVDIIITTCGTL
ncbi:MAG: deoxyhypusine synthase family protein, partial [Nitrososphaerota archaeon]|nr:deoxyhypusine synthase family protein [Nitrososphaerota archaeon]